MKPPYNALRALRLLAALIPFAAAAFAADPAKPQDTAAPTPETALHEIGASTDATVTPTPSPTLKLNNGTALVMHQEDDDGHNRVSVSDSTYVGPDETVPGNAVSVMGPLTVDGTVDGNCVSVLGSTTINGTVHGNAVVVLGKLKLGPHAHLDGNAVAGVGMVVKEPGAYVGGHIVKQGGGMDFSDDSGAYSWWEHAARKGRPLAFGPHMHAFWILSICTIALYVLLALAFPGGVTKCGETLTSRPGITLLTGILAIIALPVVFILLLITVVGIPIALVVLPIAIVACITFGKAAVYALIGRAIVKNSHPALAALVGAVIMCAFYLVPVMGGVLWIVVDFVGYACAVTALFTSRKPAPPVVTIPAASIPPAAVGLVASVPEVAPAVPPPLAIPGEAIPAVPPVAAVPPLTLVSEAALPKAGFWIRIVALLIDGLLIGMVTRVHDWFPVALAAYGAILWKLRGATVGDIIFGIKVVRIDGAPIEWVTAIVRALACFFSIVVVGLGFIWIAFDRDKQGWHDKIAGTVVVRLPKSSSLV